MFSVIWVIQFRLWFCLIRDKIGGDLCIQWQLILTTWKQLHWRRHVNIRRNRKKIKEILLLIFPVYFFIFLSTPPPDCLPMSLSLFVYVSVCLCVSLSFYPKNYLFQVSSHTKTKSVQTKQRICKPCI